MIQARPTRRWRLQLCLLAALVGASASPGAATLREAPEPGPVGILVGFQPSTSVTVMAEAHRVKSAQQVAVIPRINVHVVEVPAGEAAAAMLAYARSPDVLFAEANGTYQASGVWSDPEIGQQWQYDNTGQTGGTADADIDAFEAWEVTTGHPRVAIAILDTGIDQMHQDLSTKIVKNVDVSGSGWVDDMNGHGTHVAGSAAASSNNNLGVAGTCPQCVVYNVKVLDDVGFGSFEAVANGIIWAADNGADVISLSLGGVEVSRTVEAAVDYAWRQGSVVIAAAGNSGTSQPHYPAAYPNVIAVAATDHNDAHAGWSNYGAWVDVAAPGVSILSTGLNDTYSSGSGTSMAAPHVAGVAGLVWSTGRCGTDNACVRAYVEAGAEAIADSSAERAYGRVNAYRSVRSADSQPFPTIYIPLIQRSAATVQDESMRVMLTRQ